MKTLANINVLAWATFWVFGFLAVTENPSNAMTMSVYALVAFAGLATGIRCYIKICRIGDALAPRPTQMNEV
ncbi:hypothetical protein [Pseudooceanicola sp. MF1-13]|uniref:hypothetical protein n=1 Tax=Pseudooceanicola sp. MF1-13 TaxID=3379095 RepID=UPI0038922187